MANERAIREDLAATIDATLKQESRRNEQTIAWVRAAALLGLCGTETWYFLQQHAAPFSNRVPTYVYALASLALLVALRRGWHRPVLGTVAPIFDGLFILVRSQLTFDTHSLEILQQSMELTTVALGGALLITAGGLRLSRASLATSTLTGVALYLWFVRQTLLDLPLATVHIVLLVAVAGTTFMVTQQVRRAVRSEVARVTLARFVPAALLDGAHRDPIALVTRPREVEATVLVSDIRGFTHWAEHRDPIEVLAALNVVQGRLAAIVRQHHGMVDKFMGDGMLAVFGTPEERPDHATLAVAAAREMLVAIDELADSGAAAFRIGIGVHTGAVVVGCLGSGLRMEFTILGDTVNTASRLEGLTKELEVPVLISSDTVSAASEAGLRRVGEVTLRGRDVAIEVWTP